MKKQDRAAIILKNMNKIYTNTPIPLKHRNTYELLIAVLLSAQCHDTNFLQWYQGQTVLVVFSKQKRFFMY